MKVCSKQTYVSVAGLLALGGIEVEGGAGGVEGVDVVAAGLEGVADAAGEVVVILAGHDTSLGEPRPGGGGVATLAAEAAAGAAREEVAGRELGGDGAVASNAETVRSSARDGHSPAGTAGGLVNEGVDDLGTLGESLSSIPVGGDVVVAVLVGNGRELVATLEGTELTLDLLEGHAMEALVDTGGPASIGVLVDLSLDGLEGGTSGLEKNRSEFDIQFGV